MKIILTFCALLMIAASFLLLYLLWGRDCEPKGGSAEAVNYITVQGGGRIETHGGGGGGFPPAVIRYEFKDGEPIGAGGDQNPGSRTQPPQEVWYKKEKP